MNDLISRRKLLSKLNSTGCEITFDLPVEEILGEDVDIDDFTMLIEDAVQVYRKMVIDAICSQPTAYEVDEVVKELKEWTFNADVNIGDGTIMNHNLITSDNAIKIVKLGGVADNVCEWKCDEYGRWHTECHCLADNDPLEYTFCPYCGKKIKEVE